MKPNNILVELPSLALTGFAAEGDLPTASTDSERGALGRFFVAASTSIASARDSIAGTVGHDDKYSGMEICT